MADPVAGPVLAAEQEDPEVVLAAAQAAADPVVVAAVIDRGLAANELFGGNRNAASDCLTAGIGHLPFIPHHVTALHFFCRAVTFFLPAR